MKNFKLKYISIILTILIVLLLSTNASSTIRYVSKTGNSTPPYTTWETAADSIQKCINVCVIGDTIYVANGVYQEQVVMIPGLSLIGAGMDSCVIDTRQFITLQNYISVEMQDSCLIKGFYIISTNNFDYGRGIYTQGQTGLITENKFSNANHGIDLYGSNITAYNNYFINIRFGIGITNSNSIVRKNLIVLNVQGVEGVDIQAFSSNYTPIIDSNYIYNVYDKGIYKFFGSSPTIKNNFIQVKYSTGIALDGSDTAKVYNNVIVNAGYRGIDSYPNVKLILQNNYITGQSDQNSYGILAGPNSVIKNNVITNTNIGIGKYGTVNPVIQNNNSWNNNANYETGINPDSTNLSVDPMIVNDDSTQGELDFHLQAYSPLIDAGDPTILDRDGSRSDIGFYGGPYGWSYTYEDLVPRPPRNLSVIVDTMIILSWNKNTEADFNYYNIYRDTVNNFSIDSTKLIASVTDTFYLHTIPTGIESLYFKLTAVDNQENESNPSEEVGVLITSVEDEWKPLNNYILYQNYPNPFNPSTKIGYKLKERGYVKLYVYDIKGELVEVLVNQTQEAGYYEVEFNRHGKHQLSSGVYIYQIMVTGGNNIPVYSDIKKMIFMK